MNTLRLVVPGLLVLIFTLVSCRKDSSSYTVETIDCNTKLMKIKKMPDLSTPDSYMEVDWNADGTVKTIKNKANSQDATYAEFSYTNGKVTEAVIRKSVDNEVLNTVVYHYTPQGRISELKLKGLVGNKIALEYTAAKLTKISQYENEEVIKYWAIETDVNGNIIKATEWLVDPQGPTKEATYSFVRDTRKNPFKDLAVHLLFMDDISSAINYWGPNNFTSETIKITSLLEVDAITIGYKYKYNSNCYPISSQHTIFGVVVDPKDTNVFSYFP